MLLPLQVLLLCRSPDIFRPLTGTCLLYTSDLKAVVTGTYDKVAAKMEGWRVADAITDIFTLFKRCNKYIDETEPWVLAKDPAKADRLATVLYNLTESIVIGASLLEPYMPGTAEKIAVQLNTSCLLYTSDTGWINSGWL